MESILHERINTYNHQNSSKFVMERKSAVWYGLETLNCQYPQGWYRLQTLKEINHLSQLKK